MLNLSNINISDIDKRILAKGLGFVPIQNKIHEPELRRNFKEFCRCICLRWYLEMNLHQNLVTDELFKLSDYGIHLRVNLDAFLSQILLDEPFQIPGNIHPIPI